jgi:signal transduction histidine kinase
MSSGPPRSGSKALRPRARILRTLGTELISSDTVAVIELVKNAYDADAGRVNVRFIPPLAIGQGAIEVIDDGIGMSAETLETVWMEPATRFKADNTWSPSGRRVLGEKGIGRFAASRLAEELYVVTKQKGDANETRAFFDWTQFDQEDKYLDEIQMLWDQVAAAEISPLGTLGQLSDESKNITEADCHGTILRLQKLRSNWDEPQLEKLRTGLSRLLSPVAQAAAASTFEIWLDMPEECSRLAGKVSPPEILERAHYSIVGDVGADGAYHLIVNVKGDTAPHAIAGTFVLHDNTPPTCGPFHVEIRAWDRDRTSMAETATAYGSTLGDFKKDLDEAAGISVYRDGFRVQPYGEPHNDWLRLDMRRVQNPTLRLSNNQVIGFTSISADANPLLKDQTNREGLVESPALDDFRELIRLVLAELEKRRYAARSRERDRDTKERARSSFAKFDLEELRSFVASQRPNDVQLLKLVDENESELEKRAEEVQAIMARYHRLATLGQLIDIVLHDARAPLAKIGTEAHIALRDLERQTDSSRTTTAVKNRVSTIQKQAEVLGTVFRRIEPFAGRKRGRPQKSVLEDIIGNAFAVLHSEIEARGIKFTISPTRTETTVDDAEIQEVFINLIQNSVYWLGRVTEGLRAIDVRVDRNGAEEVQVVFSDSGPGIEPEYKEEIFHPYFSTKPDGAGLGLAIAGEIISDYYDGDLSLVDAGPLAGATFKILLRKRV